MNSENFPEELEYFYTPEGLNILRELMIKNEENTYEKAIGPTGYNDKEWYSLLVKRWKERREKK